MYNFTVVLSCDTSHHMEFVPLCARGWKKFFPECKIALAVVPTKGGSEWVKDWVDECVYYDNLNGLGMAQITKLARMYLSTQLGDDIVTFNDVDLVPLQRKFYFNRLSQYRDGKLLRMGMEVYDQTGPEQGKVPMSALTATSKLFKKLFNPIDCNWNQFVKGRMNRNVMDEKRREDPTEHHFSDESLVRALIHKSIGLSSDLIVDVERGYDIWSDTIDRADWRIDKDKLSRGEYMEAHMLKPMHDNVNRIMPIIEYIGGDDLITFYKDLIRSGSNPENIKR